MERTKHTLQSGIYQIQSIINGKIYIGSAVNFMMRKREHFNDLKKIVHHSHYLQNHYNKYGIEDLQFLIIEYCVKENLIEREQYYIDTLHPEFNIAKNAKSPMLGRHHTKESKLKTSRHHLEYYQTEEGKAVIQKNREEMLIFYQTKEGVLAKQKISKATGGENSAMKTPENRKINSEGHKRFYQTEEGKKVTKRHSEYMLSFYQTEEGKENRRKFSENHPTKKLEVRQKMKNSVQEYFKTEIGKQQKLKNIENLISLKSRQKRELIFKTEESIKNRSEAAKIGWEKRKKNKLVA